MKARATAAPADRYPSRVAGECKLLPRLDPVVYGDWHTGAPLTREQTHFYAENGFLLLEGLFDAEEVKLMQEAAGALFADPSGMAPETIIAEREDTVARSIFRIHDQHPLFAELATSPHLVDIARFLLDDEVYVHQSRLNYKAGLRGRDFFWHSDFETWHVEDGLPAMRALSMSVLLTENRPVNGPLMVMPGSHWHYVACAGLTPNEHYRQSLRQQEYGVPDDLVLADLADTHGVQPLTGPPGTVVLFDCNMIHGSNGNITPWPRSNVFMVFNACSNRPVSPFGAKQPRPEFIAARTGIEPLRPRRGRLGATADLHLAH